MDAVITYSSDFAEWGTVDWTLSGNYTEQEVTKVASPPAALIAGAVVPPGGEIPALFTVASAYNFAHSTPEYRVHFGATWEIGKYTVSLTETVNGPSKSTARSPRTATEYILELDTSFITDLEVSYQVDDSWKVAVGADNLFNEYPVKTPDWVLAEALSLNSNSYVSQYSTLSPFGINGGYYYGRLSYAF